MTQPIDRLRTSSRGGGARRCRDRSLARRLAGVALLVVAWLGVAGCATIATPEEADHVVMVGERGQLIDPSEVAFHLGPFTTYCEVAEGGDSGDPDEVDRAIRVEMERIRSVVAAIRRHPTHGGKRRVLVFVHGGLNAQNETVARVRDVLCRMRGEQDAPYVVFVNWRSAFVSSYFEHVTFVRQGNYAGRNIFTAPFTLAVDMASIVARAPAAIGRSLENAAAEVHWSNFRERAAKRTEEIDALGSEVHLPDPDTAGSPGFLEYATLPLALIAEQPMAAVLEGVGAPTWENMLRRTKMLFHREADAKRTLAVSPGGAERRGRGTGALSLFLRTFADEIGRSSDEWDVTLVGHSMGAIVVNESLLEFPDLPVDRVVYMAAACTLRDYHESVVPFLRRRPSAQMYHLTLDDDADLRETEWSVGGVPLGPLALLWPRGSLLVQIDNYYARPETIHDATAGRWSNLMQDEHLTRPADGGDALRARIHYRRFGYGWFLSSDEPHRHGGFDRFPFWRESFWTGSAANPAEPCRDTD